MAEEFGLTPDAVRALTLRGALVMLLAAERRRERWLARTREGIGLVLDGLYNYVWRAFQRGEWKPWGTHNAEFSGETRQEADVDRPARLRAKALALKAAREAASMSETEAVAAEEVGEA